MNTKCKIQTNEQQQTVIEALAACRSKASHAHTMPVHRLTCKKRKTTLSQKNRHNINMT